MDARTTFIRCALAASSPVKRVRMRSKRIEEHLDLPLTDDDHLQIVKALKRDNARLGDYYHWYHEKTLIARELKNATRARVLAMAKAADKTNYAKLDQLFLDPKGLVLAVPHFGNYILAIVRLFARYGRDRDIGVFYAPPETNKGNAVFDFIYSLCFKNDPTSRTRILHANRTGLAEAMKLLKSGGVLLMLPDVCLSPDDAYLVPFLGRTFDAMLGSASFARRTNSRLVPCMAIPTGNLAFEIRTADPIQGHPAQVPANSPHQDLAANYTATANMFATYEAWMAGRTYMWQPIREHFAKSAPFPHLDLQGLEKVWPTFLADPRVRPSDQSQVFEISAPGRNAFSTPSSSLPMH